MSEPTTDLAQPSTSEATTDVARLRPAPADIRPSACGCGGSKGSQPSFVYALGRVGYDFFSRSRQASLIQQAGKNLNDPTVLLEYLDHHEWDGASIQWVFELNETPIFIVRPAGAFADRAHAGLRRFLRQQLTEGVERVAIGGTVTGEGNLLDGRTLPVLWPDIRSMYSWTTDGLLKAVLAATPKAERSKELEGRVRDFLDRVYYQLRNLGVAPQDRAINYAATNALRVADVFRQALAEHMELDTIEVERSPVAPTDSDSWDVKMTFFDPKHRLEKARRVFRMTIDVSDTVPFNRGDARSWYVY